MGTVKYTGPVASFHCPTNAEIRSLKVHFSPKQEGSGDPSPENVRPIVGWDGVIVHNDDGVVVPEEYQKVEYLESSGVQYLNTGINGASGLNIECTLRLNSDAATANCGMIGSRENNSATRFYAISFYNKKWHVGLPNDAVYVDVQKEIKYKVRLETTTTKYTLYVNDAQIGTSNSHQETNYPLYIFACNNYGTAGRFCSGRVYSVLIDNGTTKLFNGIPCRRKSDNKPGMYDTVSGEFFTNQGTGEFICGPDVGETTNYEFGVLGKNKLNNDNEFWEVGSMDAAGGKDSRTTRIRTKDFIPALPNTTYTISISEGYSFAWDEFYSETHKYYYAWRSDSYTFTTHSDVNQLFFIIKKDDTTDITPSILENDCHIQLEFGSTATEYEPYDPNHTVYGGWVDLITGEVEATHYCENLYAVNQEQLSSNYNTSQTVFFRCNHTYEHAHGGNYGAVDLMCETLKPTGANWGSSDTQVNTITERYNSRIAVCMRMYNSVFGIVDEDDNTIKKQKINVWLAENPIKISYKLATPIAYHLAPTQLQTFLGHNNVWSNADYVEVEYDLHETQDILARKQFIVANQPHIVKPATALLQSFKTDVIAPLKECKVYFEPVQEGIGDPSPNNVREVRGWDSLNINHAPEYHLMIPLNNASVSANGITISYLNNGQYNVYGTATANANITIYTQSFIIPSGTGRYFHMNNSPLANGSNIYFITSNGSNIDVWNLASENRTSTTYVAMAGKEVGGFRIYVPNNSTVDFKLRPEFGNSRTQTTTTIDWTTEAGTIYGGYVDLISGELWETRICIDMGEFAQSHTKESMSDYLIRWKDPYNCSGAAISSHFRNNPTSNWNWMATNEGNYCQWKWGCIGISSSTLGFTTEEEWKNWLTNNDVKLVGNLSTPILITTLTSTQLKTLRGTNNIWSNANGNIELAYWGH